MLASSGGTDALGSALIAAAVALLVALLTQFGLTVRDANSRRYERRRAALLDGQHAALLLRQRVREYGLASRAHPGQLVAALTESERHFDDARSALEVALSRVDDQRVVRAVLAWQAAAQVSFVSAQDLPASQEQDRWTAMNVAIGQALKSRSGVSPG